MARRISYFLLLIFLCALPARPGSAFAEPESPAADGRTQKQMLMGLGYQALDESAAMKMFSLAHPGESLESVRAAYNPFDRMRAGRKGEKVREMQQALRDHGYDLAVDGVFGKRTKAALTAFQVQAGLLPTGSADSETLAVLLSSGAPQFDPQGPAELEIYVLNVNTGKFHKPACRWVPHILDENREHFAGSREEPVAMGFSPCKVCKP